MVNIDLLKESIAEPFFAMGNPTFRSVVPYRLPKGFFGPGGKKSGQDGPYHFAEDIG